MNRADRPALPDFDPFTDAGMAPSPCIDVCRMDPHSGLCLGCYRSIEEITQWSNADESFKRGVWLAIRQRRIDFNDRGCDESGERRGLGDKPA